MSTTELQGASVLLLGFGREGRSTLDYLQAKHPELRIAIADRHACSEVPPGIEVFTGEQYLDACTHFDTIIRSPGIPLRLPALQQAAAAGIHLTSATNIFFSVVAGRLIAVTGTKGKSTTAALIAHILKHTDKEVRLVGNIGDPMLAHAETANDQTVFVIECSSYQLEDFRGIPDLAVLLNVVEEHLDYHGSFQAYKDAKARLFLGQTSTKGKLICNPLLPTVAEMVQPAAAERISFGSEADSRCFVRDQQLWLSSAGKEQALCRVADLPLKGPGNLQNCMAAATAAAELEATAAQITEGLKTFRGLPFRLQHIGCYRGIDFYNDSLSTIPQATVNALNGLGAKVQTLIVGGHDRGLCFETLGAALAASSVEHLVIFPVTGARIAESCERQGGTAAVHTVETMQQAVDVCYRVTDSGNICLLSPASSSLNLFRDYRDRGEQFNHFVKVGGTSR